MDWLAWLFDADVFVTRNNCGAWTPALIMANQLAQATYALSYLAIPLNLYVLYAKRRHVLPRPSMFLWFAAFISLCGITHFADVLVFYWAPYRLYTVVSVIGSTVSLGTAVCLPSVVQHILSLPTPDDYRAALTEKTEAMARLSDAYACQRIVQDRLARSNQRMNAEIDALREQFVHLLHQKVTETDLTSLRARLHEIRNASMPAVTTPS